LEKKKVKKKGVIPRRKSRSWAKQGKGDVGKNKRQFHNNKRIIVRGKGGEWKGLSEENDPIEKDFCTSKKDNGGEVAVLKNSKQHQSRKKARGGKSYKGPGGEGGRGELKELGGTRKGGALVPGQGK